VAKKKSDQNKGNLKLAKNTRKMQKGNKQFRITESCA